MNGFKALIFTGSILLPTFSFSQELASFTLQEFFEWNPDEMADWNRSRVPLQPKATQKDLGKGLPKLLLSPDNLTGFSRNHVSREKKFNYFNFSHWAYVDIIHSFGGSSIWPLVIPTKEWVNACHKNGVKIIANANFMPQDWHGEEAIVLEFLQKNEQDEFIAINQLIKMANHYNFDGWMFHFETDVTNETAKLVMEFMQELNDSYDGEVIWYDAMMENGVVDWQNELNEVNLPFFKESTGIFTNYWWLEGTPEKSKKVAVDAGLNPFDVYTGVDVWPGREHQAAFKYYTWIDDVFKNGEPTTSLGVFATNFTFNAHGFSNFQFDPFDYQGLYLSERGLFAGIDLNPFTPDKTWKGFAHYFPANPPENDFPFLTSFNLGHGFKFEVGDETYCDRQWFNINIQDPLPTWAFETRHYDFIDYDFSDAYWGGNSIKIRSSRVYSQQTTPLYRVSWFAPETIQIGLVVKVNPETRIDSIVIQLKGNNGLTHDIPFSPRNSGEWEQLTSSQSIPKLDTITELGFRIVAPGRIDLNLGQISVQEANNKEVLPNLVFNESEMKLLLKKAKSFYLFDIDGDFIQRIKSFSHWQKVRPEKGVYMFEKMTKKGLSTGVIKLD